MGDRAAHLMARLTARGLTPDVVFGGNPEFSRMDVAAACARFNNLAYQLVRAKFCNDVQCVRNSIRLLAQLCLSDPRINEHLGKRQVVRLSAELISEWITNNKCPRCRGRGSIFPVNAAVKTCPRCEGAGRVTPSAAARAKIAGVPLQDWKDARLTEASNRWAKEIRTLEAEMLGFVVNHLGIRGEAA